MDKTGKREQVRREFLRISASIPVRLVCQTRDGTIPEDLWVSGWMPELGGGGAKIESSVTMSTGDVICLRFTLPDSEDEMRLYARVVEVVDWELPRTACVKFVGLSELERGKILRFLFREQIRRVKGYGHTCDS